LQPLRLASHDKNIHDSKTLNVAISHANSNRNKPIKQVVCDPHQARAMNRSCSYLWVVVLILFGKTKNLFDKFQTGCVWKVCVAIL
jgi:hypothetical protein